jgi:hypothetical protein
VNTTPPALAIPLNILPFLWVVDTTLVFSMPQPVKVYLPNYHRTDRDTPWLPHQSPHFPFIGLSMFQCLPCLTPSLVVAPSCCSSLLCRPSYRIKVRILFLLKPKTLYAIHVSFSPFPA